MRLFLACLTSAVSAAAVSNISTVYVVYSNHFDAGLLSKIETVSHPCYFQQLLFPIIYVNLTHLIRLM